MDSCIYDVAISILNLYTSSLNLVTVVTAHSGWRCNVAKHIELGGRVELQVRQGDALGHPVPQLLSQLRFGSAFAQFLDRADARAVCSEIHGLFPC